jgi:hypothetical protein
MLPAMERLAQMQPTVTTLDTENFRTPRRVPKYPFPYAAWRAANFIKSQEIGTTLRAPASRFYQ